MSSPNARPCPLDDDRFSKLPESVLYHILSFLPTRDAVATSFLSKRWEYLWRNIHNLFFTDYHSCPNTNKKFAYFVNQVFLLLNTQSIDKFYLEIGDNCELYDVTRWIDDAVGREVKELKFEFNRPSSFCIPNGCRLFICKTLEVLYLHGVRILSVPSSAVHLPNVKSIHLKFVQCDESLGNLISGCSSLETLHIEELLYEGVVFTISSPTLGNLTCMHQELDYELNINAPSLRCFKLDNCLFKDLSVKNLWPPDKAQSCSRVPRAQRCGRVPRAVFKLLQGVYHTEDIWACGEILQALTRAGLFLCFSRLTGLALQARCPANSLPDLVKGLNKLKFLTKVYGYNDMPSTIYEEVPMCLLLCLREVSIYAFEGLDYQVAAVAYILDNAVGLKTMTIMVMDTLGIGAICKLQQKILWLTRGSEECEVIFPQFLD